MTAGTKKGPRRQRRSTRGRRLTPKVDRERIFAEEYARDTNALQACIRAGYSAKTAQKMATVLMQRPHVRAMCEQALAAHRAHCALQTDVTLDHLAAIGHSDFRDIARTLKGMHISQVPELPAHVTCTIKALELTEDGFITKIALWDKMEALEMAARYLKLINEAQEKPLTGVDVGSMTQEEIEQRLAEIYQRQVAKGLLPAGGPVVEGQLVASESVGAPE